MKLKVGQKLWWVRTRWNRIGNPLNDGAEVEVTSVGRKWVHVNRPGSSTKDARIDLDSLIVDGGEYSSPGQCYLSREDYRQQCAVDQEWVWLKRMFPHNPPPGITIDSIQLIASVLKLELRKTA